MRTRSLQEFKKKSYFSDDTIAAPATALGGPVAILRVSGSASKACLALLAPRLSWENIQAGRFYRTPLLSKSGTPIDDAMIVKFDAPKSFTGEDVLEIHHHGNPVIAEEILKEIFSLHIRKALPGEFSFRAVRNGKMTLPQAEALSDLISASHESAAQLALEKLSGSQQKLLTEIAEGIRQAMAQGELGIDFSDQDVEELGLEKLKARLIEPIKALQQLQESFKRGIILQEGVKTAIVGIPNAGKSTFFNLLLGEDRSIVTEIAGTTRDEIRETLSLESEGERFIFRLSDTAGLRQTEDLAEALGVKRAQKAAEDADLVLWMIEPLQGERQLESQIKAVSEWMDPDKTIGIISKCDALSDEKSEKLKRKLSIESGLDSWIKTSAQKSVGIEEVIKEMVKKASLWSRREKGEVLLTRSDHQNAVSVALLDLKRALSAKSLDLFAADLRQTLHGLAPLIGETIPDDILGRIFSQFCIGK